MDIPNELAQQVVEFVKQSGELLEKKAAEESKVAEKAPDVIDALIKAGMLDSSKRADAIAKASDPIRTLESLQKTAEWVAESKKTTKAAPSLGKAAGVERPVASKTPAKESDRIWSEGFGLPNRG